MEALASILTESQQKIQNLLERLDVAEKKNLLEKLRKESQATDLWDNQTRARKVMKTLSSLEKELEGWAKLENRLADARELVEMGDSNLEEDLTKEIHAIQQEIEKREFDAMLAGEYDRGDALLAIHAGAGGNDAQDWAEMVQRMYLRWAEKRGFETETLDLTPGEEAGIKSTTISISGLYAYGYLRSEKGVHRLVRISPFDSSNRRHTSFVLVEILPQVDDDESIKINPNDLRIDTFRSAGAGGQSVQKNDTAVRITHIPTGIVASCQNERSQTQNREMALKVLKGRLLALKQQERKEKIEELRGEYQKAEWGSQIRSYVLHPYHMVKDHRTDFEMGNTEAVLDGELDPFIESYLRFTLGDKAS
ncbi:MAG: peptide chain release factor 2 [Chloroflexota bacterium]|nr:MAG: peptide chain release factor 2 [Chloroflexota bacterium]HDD56314.1 peptide chain release factor 2 [Chloroflexota bacterium]